MIITHSIISEKSTLETGNSRQRQDIKLKKSASGKHLIVNGDNLETYARKQFTAHRQTMKPEVNQEILKKETIL